MEDGMNRVFEKTWLLSRFAFAIGIAFNGQATHVLATDDNLALPPAHLATTDQAATYLRRAGAILTEDEQGRIVRFQMPESLGLNVAAWPYIARLTDLRDLDLGALQATNDQLKHLQTLKNVRKLNLFGNPIDSVALQNIVRMQNLETLYLYRTFVDKEGIAWIVQLKNLKRLNLFDTFMDDQALSLLEQCQQLRHLSIGNSKAGNFPESFFSKAAINRLRKSLPNTKITKWGDTEQLDRPLVLPTDSTAARPPSTTKLTLSEIKPADDLATRDSGEDWPTFLGPTQDGRSTETGLHLNWQQRLPEVAWHHRVGTGFAAPSVSRGRLLLYHRVRTKDADHRFAERLSCWHAESGDAIWNVDFPTSYEDLNGYGDGPRSTPVIDGDRVYLLSPQGKLRCLQIVDGQTVWEVDLVSQLGLQLATYGVGTTPVVHGKQLLVIVGGEHPKTGKTGVAAFDKLTGIFKFNVGTGGSSYATPRIVRRGDRNWCFAFMREGLLMFDPDQGRIDEKFDWRSNIAGSVNAMTPVVKDNEVFISESYTHGGAMLRFGATGLSEVWKDGRQKRDKSMSVHWATPIVHEGNLYGCSGRHSTQGVLRCVDWNNGSIRWQQTGDLRTSSIYADGRIISLSENGPLFVAKAKPDRYEETGRIDKNNAQVFSSYPAWTAPILARGMLYVRGKHELIAYDLKK